jgi:hypothetical protein
MYEPQKPLVSVQELEETDPESYDFLMRVFSMLAVDIYKASPETNELGLEKNIETLIELQDKGLIKLMYDDEQEMIRIGIFNPLTGDYHPPSNGKVI